MYYVLNDKKFPPGTPVGFYQTLDEARLAVLEVLEITDDVVLEIYSLDPANIDPETRLPTRVNYPLEDT